MSSYMACVFRLVFLEGGRSLGTRGVAGQAAIKNKTVPSLRTGRNAAPPNDKRPNRRPSRPATYNRRSLGEIKQTATLNMSRRVSEIIIRPGAKVNVLIN